MEEGTWLRVTVTVPANKDAQGRGTAAWRDQHLYNAMRGERSKANRKATVAARRRSVADQLPQGAGDLQTMRFPSRLESVGKTWHMTLADCARRELEKPRPIEPCGN